MRVLLAGMGNVLHGDDGFGVAVADALAARPWPPGVDVIEVGIGGIHLVQALLDGYDALVLLDTVDRGAPPGTIFVLRPRVPALDELSPAERHELLADMHYTVPSRAMILARALDSLPGRTWIVGCQPRDAEGLGMELSDEVERAVPEAVQRVAALVEMLHGAPERGPAREAST